MNRYLYIVVALLSLSLFSCENSFNDSKACPQVVGRWALVEADGTVHTYIEFREGNLTEYQVERLSYTILYEDGILWGCTVEDFVETIDGYYTINNSVITSSIGYKGSITVDGDILKINGQEYRYIEDFTSNFHRKIEVDLTEDIVVGFSETEVLIPYKVTNASEGTMVSVAWSGSLEYTDFELTENTISFKVMATDVARSSRIAISYPGAQSVEVVVNQKCDRPEYMIHYTTTDDQKLSISGSIEYDNPIAEHIYVDGKGTIIFSKPLLCIRDESFEGCSKLKSIIIPDGVTSIGEDAFFNCDSLENITIPDGVTSVGHAAFFGCDSLTSVTIPDSVTSIGDSAFYNCDSLENITIPDGVTSIGSSAFEDCVSLTSITIPDSVTTIGDSAFSGCTGELIVNSKIIEVDYTVNDRPSGYGGWLYENKFAELIIGDNITKIGDNAFYGCTLLTSVTIGNGVTSIGDNAFRYCTSLTNVTIGNGVTTIGEWAFYECDSLKSVTIPDSVTSIGDDAFRNCTSLTSVTIGNCVTSIGRYAFYGCDSLTSVTIGNGVTSIGDDAFRNCTSLTSVTIGNCVTSIGRYAFYGCDSLTSVTIGNGVTSIGNHAFYSCDLLTSVTIGNGVTLIGDYAFGYCTSLTEVYCRPTTPPSLGKYAFKWYDSSWNLVNIGCTIYVPTASVETYKLAEYWSDYASDIVGYNF